MSTRSSLYCIERDEMDNHASLHIYTECFDREDDIFIEVWMQGEEENTEETIMIPKDLWDKAVAQITKEQVSELEAEKSSFQDDIIRFNDICVKKTRGLAKQLKTAVDALENIAEYWNQNRNDMAMHDACLHSINTADEAIAAIIKDNQGTNRTPIERK